MSIKTNVLIACFICCPSYAALQGPTIPLSSALSSFLAQFLVDQRQTIFAQTAEFCKGLNTKQKERFVACINEAQSIESDTVQTILKNKAVCKKIDELPEKVEALLKKYADIIELYKQASGSDLMGDSFGLPLNK